MDLSVKLSPARPSGVPARRTPRLAVCLFLGVFGASCADTGASTDEDGGTVPPITFDASTGGFDAGTGFPLPGFDAGALLDAAGILANLDSGTKPAFDGGTGTTNDGGGSATDAGSASADAGAKDGGGFMLPDLFPDAGPAKDAGTTPSGTRDVHGPCKDLNLICFDGFDMFILNAECSTCNSGKGCAGCALPYAF